MALGYQNPFYLKKAQQKKQSLYNGKVLLEKHDPPDVYDSEETLQLAQESRLKMKQLKKEIKSADYAKINHLSGVFVNQVDARVQNFEIQFLKEAAKFVQDFKSLAKEAGESLSKRKALEFEIECVLKAAVSQLIMSIVQNNSVVDTSNLQTELDRMKEKLKNCIIKKEKEYVVLWNDCSRCHQPTPPTPQGHRRLHHHIPPSPPPTAAANNTTKAADPAATATTPPLPLRRHLQNHAATTTNTNRHCHSPPSSCCLLALESGARLTNVSSLFSLLLMILMHHSIKK
nr:hypothetical protein [Tanacetum cinerariifolium]